MATQDVEVLQVNTQPAQQSVAGLRNEIKRLKGELLSLEQGSKEYNEVLAEVANKTHQLKEITEQVNRSSADFGDRLRNVQGTVAGLSGAFQTVLGSLSLMGIQIGDDVKMLKMLQSAMAITQGVAAIDTGVKAFKALTISIKASAAAMSGLKKALITSGIGVAAVAVGVLVSKLTELNEKNKEVEQSTKDLADAQERLRGYTGQLNKAYQDIIELIDYQARLDAASGKSTIETNNKKLASLRELMAKEKANLDSLRQYEASVRDVQKEEAGKMVKDQEAVVEDIAKRILAIERDTQVERTRIATEQAKKRAAAERDTYKVQPTTPIDNIPAPQEGVAETEQQEAELQALTEYYQRRAEIIIANESNVDEQLLNLDMQYRDKREELLRTRLEDGLITQQEFNNELAQLEVEAAELQIEQEELVTSKTKEQLEKRKHLYANYTKAVKSVTDSLTSILGSVAGTLEEGTQEWKGVMIAKSVIETIAGGITAYMTTMREVGGGVQGIIAGAAAAAAVLAAGYAEVAKIRATDVSGGNASAGGSMGSVSPAAVRINATQVTPTRNVQTEEDIANLPDTRVYVTEQDITAAQRRVRVTNENATY